MRPYNLCITGNIASGKTTFARMLTERYPDSCCVPEPYDRNPFLPLYLQDQRRWGFTAQLRYFWDYVQIFNQVTEGKRYRYHFIDAGIWTNRMVYGRYLYGEGIMSPDEYAFYETLCDTIQAVHHYPEPNAFVFLSAPEQICWERMRRRGWAYQVSAVELDYIGSLARYVEKMKQDIAARNIPILEISSGELDYTTSEGQAEALRRVQRFLELYERAHP